MPLRDQRILLDGTNESQRLMGSWIVASGAAWSTSFLQGFNSRSQPLRQPVAPKDDTPLAHIKDSLHRLPDARVVQNQHQIDEPADDREILQTPLVTSPYVR